MATLQKKPRQNLEASIVIPTFQRPTLAFNLVRQIRKFDKKIEIIIVDQENKKPVSKNIINELKIKYFNLEKANTSLAKNKGIRESTGNIIIFFDDDVEITKKTIPAHLTAYAVSGVAGVAGRVITDGDKLPQVTKVDTGQTDFFGLKFIQKFWSTKRQNIDFPYGCNMSFRKTALEKAGCFDENLPKIFEEVDLGVRISRKIGTIEFVPETLVYHHKAGAGGIRQFDETNKIKQQFILKNYGIYLAKNVPFLFSLLSVLIRSKAALSTSFSAFFGLWKSYLTTLIKQSTIIAGNNLPFVFLLFIDLFFRFFKVKQGFVFNIDEEYQALLGWAQVKDFHPVWVGVSASNTGYYLGPGLVYLSALLLKLSKGNPLAFGYFASFIGVITFISLYFITHEFFGKKIALITGIFYTFSPLVIFYDRKFWPMAVPLTALWLFYSLVKSTQNTKWLILTGILMGGAYHLHLSLWLFWPLIFATVFIVRKKIKLITWIGMVGTYLIMTSTLLFFDFIHNFDNLLMPYQLIKGVGHGTISPHASNHFALLVSTIGKLWPVPSELADPGSRLILTIISLAGIIFLIRQKNLASRLIVFLIILFAFGFILFPGPVQEYYFVVVLPFFAILFGVMLSKIPKTATIISLILFIALGLYSFINYFPYSDFLAKENLINQVKTKIKNESFSLNFAGNYIDYGGWRYLFQCKDIKPNQSQADQMFGWIYPDEISDKKTRLKIVVSRDQIPPSNGVIKKLHVAPYYLYFYLN